MLLSPGWFCSYPANQFHNIQDFCCIEHQSTRIFDYQEAIYMVQGVLGLHKFWAREKIVQANFVLVKLCTSSFVKHHASEILSMCYPRNGLYLKIRASKIRASQGPYVNTNFL